MRRDNSVNYFSAHAKRPPGIDCTQVGQHGLASNRGLAFGSERPGALGQIDINS